MSIRLPLSDIQFITDFAAYARARGDAPYDYMDVGNCAACQFLRDEKGAIRPHCGGSAWADDKGPYTQFPEGVGDCDDQCGALAAHPRTFSALADRLEALLVDAPIVERVS